jgi:nucleotide-binding universal stress UspA family protein
MLVFMQLDHRARQAEDPTERCCASGAVRRGRIGHVLLATDLSTASRSATDEALALAERDRARLTVLSVVDPGGLRVPGGRFFRRVDQERAEIEAGVQSIVARARGLGVAAAYLVWVGDPAESILEAADSERADVIVMGSHGRGRVGRLLLGSTSSRVSAASGRPVRVVPS